MLNRETEICNIVIGAPWSNIGEGSLTQGFNCWTFFKWFYLVFIGVNVVNDYDDIRAGDTVKIVKAFSKAISTETWVKQETPKQYDAVALSINKKIHHVGIWFNNGCLHAVKGQGVCHMSKSALLRNGYTRVEYYTCTTL